MLCKFSGNVPIGYEIFILKLILPYSCECNLIPSLLPTTVTLVFSMRLAKHGMRQTGLVMGRGGGGRLLATHPQVNIPTTN